MQALGADLGGLLQDAEVVGVAGEGGTRAEVAGALARAAALAAGRALQANRYFSQGLAGQPARGGPRSGPGERGEGGPDGAPGSSKRWFINRSASTSSPAP